MSDRGTPQTFELTWQSGHVERIQAHQVSYPDNTAVFLGRELSRPPRIQFHGEFDGHWRLVLSTAEDDLARIRNVTLTETALDANPTEVNQ